MGQRAVVFASVIAGLVLGAATAAYPMYVSASGTGALSEQVGAQCRWLSGMTVPIYFTTPAFAQLRPGLQQDLLGGATPPAGTPEQIAAAETAKLTAVHRSVPALGAPVTTFVVGGLSASVGREVSPFTLMARDGALSHVAALTPPGGRGVWVSSLLAQSARVTAGSRMTVSALGRQVVVVPVAGVYRDIKSQPHTASSWWCSEANLIYYQPPDYVPPPLVLADQATLISVATALGEPVVGGVGELPLRSGTSLSGASGLLQALPGAARRAGISDVAVQAGTGAGLRTSLPFEVARARALGSVVRSGTGPVWAASIAAGLALLAAAGVLWAQKRAGQLALFDSQGVGVGAVGAKAILEMAVPAAVGAAVGWVIARLVVGVLGPASAPEHPAEVRAAVYTGAALVTGLVVVGAVVAVQSAHVQRTPAGRWWRRGRWVPAEVGLLIAALLVAGNTSVAQSDAGSATKVVSVGASSVVFPLLLVAASMVLAARLAPWLLALLRRGRYRRAPWMWLASRRLAHRTALAVLVVAVGMVPVALFGYGAGVSASAGATLQAKGSVFVGSDVRVELPLPAALPADLRSHATEVLRLDNTDAGGSPVDVIGVDPATFAAGAYWDPTLAPGRTLPGLLRLLQSPGTPAPALVAGTAPTGQVTAGPPSMAFPYRAVASLRAFPGLTGSLIVVDSTRLTSYRALTSEEVWAKGSPEAVVDALTRAGVLTGVVVSRTEALDSSAFRATAWTVDYLTTAAWVFAAMSVVGLVLYIDGRQRNRSKAYVLARRAGLRRRTHLLSLALELGLPAGVGVAAGIVIAAVGTHLIAGHLDAFRDLPPTPLVRVPPGPLAVGAAIIAAAITASCVIAQRAADTSRPSEVLRDAG